MASIIKERFAYTELREIKPVKSEMKTEEVGAYLHRRGHEK